MQKQFYVKRFLVTVRNQISALTLLLNLKIYHRVASVLSSLMQFSTVAIAWKESHKRSFSLFQSSSLAYKHVFFPGTNCTFPEYREIASFSGKRFTVFGVAGPGNRVDDFFRPLRSKRVYWFWGRRGKSVSYRDAESAKRIRHYDSSSKLKKKNTFKSEVKFGRVDPEIWRLE